MTAEPVRCAERLEITALAGLPLVTPKTDLAHAIVGALERAGIVLASGDVLAVASKLVSRAEGRFVDLAAVAPSRRAVDLGAQLEKDPRFVELVLRESIEISRTAPGVLIVRNRLGVICANAGIDLSNARPLDAPEDSGPWALLLPEAPDETAERLRRSLAERTAAAIGVLITDSVGRPFRLGSVGLAIGVSGLPPIFDHHGHVDLYGMPLEHTATALADQVATAADLVSGQADERRGVVHVHGLRFTAGPHSAKELLRPHELDLYASSMPNDGDNR